ncbi:MAG: hypothetical protein ACFFEM_16010, partial [Candidatus Thorarchaeota archaeon]
MRPTMLTESQKQEWRENRQLSTKAVIARLPENVKPYAFIVGAWVWIDFPRKPKAETLEKIKPLGFKWNKKRKVWQHPCGEFRPFNPKTDPRDKYGEIPLAKATA